MSATTIQLQRPLRQLAPMGLALMVVLAGLAPRESSAFRRSPDRPVRTVSPAMPVANFLNSRPTAACSN